VSLSGVQGSGPGGRVVAADVQAAQAAGGARMPAPAASGDLAAAFTDEAVKQIQKVTARRLLESKTTVPHYYVSYECKMDALLALRAKLNEQLAPAGVKISVNDFMIKASAAALRDVPDVNASWFGDYIRRYQNVDVTVAVQTPAGLMVPIVRDADLKGLQTISAEVKALASKVLPPSPWRAFAVEAASCVLACPTHGTLLLSEQDSLARCRRRRAS
jgi:pyruvate dehydrogenase E2 component (dihydrolipoamide acetyltransferase)